MRTYEVLFILSPQVPEEEGTTLINEFKGVAEKTGAALTSEEAWGRRRLAYPISKFNEGNYHLFVFESEGSMSELDRRMKNSDRILRHMIVRTDLDHKRADKLAKRNPKKERVRPAPSFAGAPSVGGPSAMSPQASSAAPQAAAPAQPVAEAPAALSQPVAEAPAVPSQPVAEAPAATPAEPEVTPTPAVTDETPQA